MSKAQKLAVLPSVVRPDGKGRIYLGSITEGVSGYLLSRDNEGTITLIPQVEIPAREIWLWKTPGVYQAIQEGLEQSRNGQVSEMDFSAYADLPDDPADKVAPSQA